MPGAPQLEGAQQPNRTATAELGIAEHAPHAAPASRSAGPEHAKLAYDIPRPIANGAHASDPTTEPFDPGVHRDRGYRVKLIASGALLPLASRPTLRMDARAHRAAKRHMESGDYGRKILPVPPGFFTLPAWHTAALEARERRLRTRRGTLWARASARAAIAEYAETFKALASR